MTPTRQKVRPHYQKYPDAFKREVVQRYLNTPGSSYQSISEHYKLLNRSVVKDFYRWYKDHPEEILPPPVLTEAEMEDISLLQLQVKELTNALKHEQLRSQAYDTMIEVAEKELGIEIRKKRVTKQ
jgi:transposase-like protein